MLQLGNALVRILVTLGAKIALSFLSWNSKLQAIKWIKVIYPERICSSNHSMGRFIK
jgi:hypothetical protein